MAHRGIKTNQVQFRSSRAISVEDAAWLEKYEALSELQVVGRAFVSGFWLLIWSSILCRVVGWEQMTDPYQALLIFSTFRYAVNKWKSFRLKRRMLAGRS